MVELERLIVRISQKRGYGERERNIFLSLFLYLSVYESEFFWVFNAGFGDWISILKGVRIGKVGWVILFPI